jgi:hypothetical protein
MAFRIGKWNMDEFERIRHAQPLVALFEDRGAEWVGRLNDELHSAQAKRKQPVEDGYDAEVTTGGSRARLYVRAFTARAMAHEAANQSILKNMPIGGVPKKVTPVDPNLPRELAERSLDAQGGRIGGQA